jgi:hypothetical protein
LDRAELEELSSKELHDRAVSAATRHADVGFLWDLVKFVPPARAAAGDIPAAEIDITRLSSLLYDFVHAGEGKFADELRPLYIEYLVQKG